MLPLFRELQISGPDEEIGRLVSDLISDEGSNWQHDKDAQSRVDKGEEGTDRKIYTFAYKGGRLPHSLLFLEYKRSRLTLNNIIPKEGISRLSKNQYNDLIEDFSQSFIRNHIKSDFVVVELSSAEKSIDEWLSPRSSKLLRAFSSLANKGTGSSHPLDNERWMNFLICAHEDEVKLDGATLIQWLVEEETWPSSVAWDLATEYEQARKLLKQYDVKNDGR